MSQLFPGQHLQGQATFSPPEKRVEKTSIQLGARQALQDPQPEVNTLSEGVYVNLWSQRDIVPPVLSDNDGVETTYRDAANRALDEEMARDDKVILLGEDIGIHGGAFQVRQGAVQKIRS